MGKRKETPEQIAYREARKAKLCARKERIRAMTPAERSAYNAHKKRSKAGMQRRFSPPQEDESGGECMKCGFRTHRDWCPDCGRPVW